MSRTSIHLTRVFSSDNAKCGRLIVNRGKVKRTCGISLQKGQIDDLDEGYNTLESCSHSATMMKRYAAKLPPSTETE